MTELVSFLIFSFSMILIHIYFIYSISIVKQIECNPFRSLSLLSDKYQFSWRIQVFSHPTHRLIFLIQILTSFITDILLFDSSLLLIVINLLLKNSIKQKEKYRFPLVVVIIIIDYAELAFNNSMSRKFLLSSII